jgi:hypothetical protein
MKHGCRAKTLFRIPHQRLRIEMEQYDGDTGARSQARDLISQQSPVGAIGLLSIPTSQNYLAEAATNHAIQYQRGQSSCHHDGNPDLFINSCTASAGSKRTCFVVYHFKPGIHL